MGITRREARFGSEDGSTWLTAEAVIDTGSTHCQISESVQAALGARPFRRGRVLLANGDVDERDIVYVQLELAASLPAVLTTAVVGPEGCPSLVGAVALELLGLAVDPSTQQLIPDLPVLLRSADWPTL